MDFKGVVKILRFILNLDNRINARITSGPSLLSCQLVLHLKADYNSQNYCKTIKCMQPTKISHLLFSQHIPYGKLQVILRRVILGRINV